MSAGKWIAHDGKGMPVAGEVMVLCRFNDGQDDEASGAMPRPANYWHGSGLNDSNWIGDDESTISECKVIAND